MLKKQAENEAFHFFPVIFITQTSLISLELNNTITLAPSSIDNF